MSKLFQSSIQIDLLRHGECEGGEIFRGSTDVALLDKGFKHMQQSCETVGEAWDRVISSPLQRCQAFAHYLSEKKNIPLEINESLREMSFGDWEGQNISDIWENYPAEMKAWMHNPEVNTPPNGEALVDVAQRIDLAIQAVQKHAFEHSPSSQHVNGQADIAQRILLVVHGGIIRVLLAKLLGMPLSNTSRFYVPYACMSRMLVYQTESGPFVQLVAHHFAK